jgi:hypothetical protein
MFWVMADGMSDSGVLVVHLVCLLARRSRPYVAVLNVGRFVVNEYGQVLSWGDITRVMLVMGSSSYSGCTGYVEFSCTCSTSSPSGGVGSLVDCMWASWMVRIERIVVLLSTS